jgi:hypothetical protein
MDKFLGNIISKSPNGKVFVQATNKNTDQFPQLLKDLEIKIVSVSGNCDVSYLNNLDFIEGLVIGTLPKDFEILYSLKNLKFIKIYFEQKDIGFAFDAFESLEECDLNYSPTNNSFYSRSSLERLTLQHYKEKNLFLLKHLSRLKRLKIVNSALTSLGGTEFFPFLEVLELYNLYKLESLEGAKSLNTLKVLLIENCSKITDLEELRNLNRLEYLMVDNCKELKSLEPLKNLQALRKIHLLRNTIIEDGDLSPLIGREDAIVPPKKHYSISPIEIDRLNGTIRPPRW